LHTSLPESADQPAVVTSKPDFFNGIGQNRKLPT